MSQLRFQTGTSQETILEIMQHPQVRLTEKVIKIIRGNHPHMEALLHIRRRIPSVNHRIGDRPQLHSR